MTELIRSAKSGSDWMSHELAAYNIVVEYQNAATFFGTPNLPQPATINPAVLTAASPDDAADDGVYGLLRYDGFRYVTCPSRGICCRRFCCAPVACVGLQYEVKGFKNEEGHPSYHLWRG